MRCLLDLPRFLRRSFRIWKCVLSIFPKAGFEMILADEKQTPPFSLNVPGPDPS